MTRILIDTNIFISAVLFPKGRTSLALQKALLPPYQPVTSDYVIRELREKFDEKFPERMPQLDTFLMLAFSVIEIVPTPEIYTTAESKIRDVKDRPILRAAISANAELLITGDKDFLESGIATPRIISVAEFLDEVF